MSAEITRKLFTLDDCLRMVGAGILHEDDRVELIRGDLLQMSPIGPRHAAAVSAGTRWLVRVVADDAIVQPGGTTRLDQFSAPQPDLALLRPREDFYASQHPGPSDILLIIEVADSSLEYDTTVKAELYAIMGIPEYWVADLRNDRLLVYAEPQGGSYRNIRELHAGDMIAPQLLPSCRLNVAVLLP